MDKKKFLLILGGSLIFSSFEGVKSAFDFPKVFYLVTAGGLFASFYLWRVNRLAGLFSGLVSLCFLRTSLYYMAPAHLISYNFITIFSCLGFYYIARRLSVSLEDLKKYIFPFILINIGMCFYQIFIYKGFMQFDVEQLTGFMGSTARVAPLLSMSIPLVVSKFGLIASFPILFVLYHCKTLFGIISAVSGMFLFSVLQIPKKTTLILLCLLIALCGIYFRANEVKTMSPQVDYRIAVWTETLDHIFRSEKHALFGWGLGSFHAIFTNPDTLHKRVNGTVYNYKDSWTNHPHNEFLLGWFEMGVGFIILSMTYLIDLVQKMVKYRKDRELAVIFSSIVSLVIYANGCFLVMYLWAVAAVLLASFENRVSTLEGGFNA